MKKGFLLDAYNLMIEEEQETFPPKFKGKVKQIQVFTQRFE